MKKKSLIVAACVSTIVLSIFIVSCSKRESTVPQTTSETSNKQASNPNRMNSIPVNPGTPPDPSKMILGGPEFCTNMTYQILFNVDISNCVEEWGVICGWNVLQCEIDKNAINTHVLFPNIDGITTGIVYVKLQSDSKNDLSGKSIIVTDNLLMGDQFNKQLNCDATYLLKGEYTFQSGNDAALAVYIVNHRK